MNRLFPLFLIGLCLSISQLFAQSMADIQQQIDHILAPLDLTEVHTDILADKAPEYIPLDAFNGTLSDSNWVNSTRYSMIYSMLETAHFPSTPLLPDPQNGYLGISDTLQDSSPIPISLLHFDYQRLREDAVDLNLLDSLNGQLQDVVGRPQSPYVDRQLFVGNSLLSEVSQQNLTFCLSSNLLYTNTTENIQQVQIDFGDGLGFRSMNLDQCLAVSYVEDGLKHIKLYYVDSQGDSLWTQFVLWIEAPATSRVYAATPDAVNTTFPHCTAHIYYNPECGDNLIRKPLIFIEGFNPTIALFGAGGLGPLGPGFMRSTILPFSNTTTGIPVIDALEAEGYDLIYVDFDDGAGDIPTNAQGVKAVIRWANGLKAMNGSSSPTIVIGASMGGVVGKWALREMEINGENHEVEKFISFDSPFHGANLPIGIQAFARDLIDLGEGFSPVFEDARDVLTSPAAKQMLFYNIYAPNPPFYDQYHNDFYAQFNALGDLGIEHLAIANGSRIGQNQTFAPGAEYIDFDFSFNNSVSLILPNPEGFFEQLADLVLRKEILGKLDIKVKVKATPTYGQFNQEIYSREIDGRILLFSLKSERSFSIFADRPLDSAPGGVQGVPVGLTGGINFPGLEIGPTHFCFIPTFSALAIPEPSDITAPVDCSMSSADKCVASVDNTTILSFTGLPDHNQRHVRFSTKNANFFVYELTSLQGLNTINSIANRTYNFGETDEPFDPGVSGNNFSQRSTPTIISQSLDILSGGEVFINKGDRIDFTDVNFHPQNTVESNFTVSLNPRCSAVEVRVHDGGRMVVGDGNVENTGELIVEAETQLIIKTGGQLKINQDCKVIVKEGGRLVIENGGELSVGIRGQLVVEEDADLRIEGDALINLINPSANCHIQGKLAIQDKFDFPGYGYFQFDNTHELYLENDFYLYGRGKSHRFIRLNDNAELNFGSKLAWLENGRVEYGQYTKMVSEAGGTVKLYSVELLGNGDATGIYSNGGSRVQLQDTDLISFFRGVGMENSSSSVNLIGINSYFFNCFNGVDMANCRRADLVDCTFEAGDQGSYGMFLENVEEVNVRQTNMSGYDGPGAGLFEAAILSYNVNLLTVEGGTFEHNNCGIYCPLDGTVNVHLHSQATLRENRVGVLIDNSGWVKMDCARLIDNQEAGIGGNDIQLEIDACINSGDPTCGNIRSNHFEVSSGYHIDVCYLQSAPSNVLARGNYWKGYGNPNVTRIRLRGNGSGNCSGAIPIDRSFPLSAPPTDCSLNQEEPDPDVIIGRSQPATGQQPNKPTTQKEEFTHTEIQSIKLFPNPSQTSVTLQLPEGQYQVQVFDISGRKIRENRETQSVEWEVRQWDAGTYLIKILDLHSGIDTIEKLIVL